MLKLSLLHLYKCAMLDWYGYIEVGFVFVRTKENLVFSTCNWRLVHDLSCLDR